MANFKISIPVPPNQATPVAMGTPMTSRTFPPVDATTRLNEAEKMITDAVSSAGFFTL